METKPILRQSNEKPENYSHKFKILVHDKSGNPVFASLECDPNRQAHEVPQVFAGLNTMIAHSAGIEKIPKADMMMIREAMRRNKMTIKEAIDGFWKAYGDPYVPQGRIEFRHIWKHVEKERQENGVYNRLMSHEEMLTHRDKNYPGVPTDKIYETIHEGDKVYFKLKK
jgi:hypothetical protein